MSELQVGLLAVGAVFVAAVFLYNKWQERRYRREAEAGFASRHEDVLIRPGEAAQGIETMLGSFDAVQDYGGDSDQELYRVLGFRLAMSTSDAISPSSLAGAA